MRKRLAVVLAGAVLTVAALGVALGTYYDLSPTAALVVPVAGTYYDQSPTVPQGTYFDS